MFSEAIRRYGFWLVDALGGRQIRKYLLNMEGKLQGNSDMSSDDLRKLLNHAVRTTAFYRQFRHYSSISDFPIITKGLIKENYDQFISSDYKNKRMYKIGTSGSTGERFVMLQNRQKRKRVLAELIYFYGQCRFRLGYRYVYIRVWYRDYQKTKMVTMAQNLIMFDCSSLSDQSLDRLYELLTKDRTIKCLTGYATSLAAIAVYFDKKGYRPEMFNLAIICSVSERLDPRDKALLKKVFDCPVVSRYSNQENGVLAQQSIDSDNFILNTAHYFFETIRLDDDEPAPYNEPARLIVTDLYNYAMPLIRYDTGDIVVMEKQRENDSEKKVLTEVLGRQEDVICDTQGNKISAYCIIFGFRRFEWLPLFQFIQENLKQFTVKVEGAHNLYDDEDIRKTVKEIVGADADVKIEHVDKIPRLSSGKVKRIICNYEFE